jgi:hypothetical protein
MSFEHDFDDSIESRTYHLRIPVEQNRGKSKIRTTYSIDEQPMIFNVRPTII